MLPSPPPTCSTLPNRAFWVLFPIEASASISTRRAAAPVSRGVLDPVPVWVDTARVGWGKYNSMGGATQSVRGNYKSFTETNLTLVEGMHQFIVYILRVYIRIEENRAPGVCCDNRV